MQGGVLNTDNPWKKDLKFVAIRIWGATTLYQTTKDLDVV